MILENSQEITLVEPTSDPILLKILVLLDKIGILTGKRIAEILNISRDGPPAKHKLEQLESLGLIRATGTKRFGIRREINLWELTETGKRFVAKVRNDKKLPKVKLSEMNGELKIICSEIMDILEMPKSVDELDITLKAAGVKIRKYKLGDALRILEAAALIKKIQMRKEIKLLERIGMTKVSDVPGGILTYIRIEGAGIDSAEI
ncbi:MAG TPA: hypothetical protein VN368_02465 [Candidatus Methylomirabilis sp.]|nr:hypothetical protein [Candidatus Methylomirabilis sp.]